ncbi:MarR family winged helix-turn-helix transcriptional regulator [Streptomyces sp. NBC_00893]|uniref:MarR family winged helix-turn-helix transcriptional regulator n=1 Tax=Streptomyces sp. NBC_00893 TaxID=2975862 RepID=UPI00225B1275|nr:MarR family transcriptional regulator [Streptomyces sp. NBC_00893]MCX4847570.1 MarR family transcriptional regulator [Streptomyces sp. NBC_00893]
MAPLTTRRVRRIALADHLQGMGAVDRVRDPHDRRRQVLGLTDRGRELLGECAAAARALDDELMAGLDGPSGAALHRALGVLGRRAGLPGGMG